MFIKQYEIEGAAIMAYEERRNAERLPVQVDVIEEYQGKEQCVTCLNISEYGMLYKKPGETAYQKGEEVFLTFSLIDRLQPIKALGWVVDERPAGQHFETHVTFMFLPEKDEQFIREYIALQRD